MLAAPGAELPRLSDWLPVLGDTPLNISFFLAIIALAVYGVMVSRSSWGYKLRATGLNQHAAHYAGVKISAMIIVTMLISGALAGLGAVNAIMGSTHYLSLNFPAGAFAQGAGPEVKAAKLGFIALTDASPLFIAKEKGIFAKHGVQPVTP